MALTKTRDRLVEIAIEMIWKNSYSSVSVDDLCKAADIRKGSFYHYFKSKAELAIAAMEQHYQKAKVDFDDVFSPTHTPLERFERYATLRLNTQKQIFSNYGHVCGCPFTSIDSEMASQDDLIRETADKLSRRHQRYYESTLRDMVAEGLLPEDTDIMARAGDISGYICGQMTRARVQSSLEPLEHDLKIGLLNLLGLGSKHLEASRSSQ